MKRKYILILIALFISLFIYLFYRTDHTLVNRLLIYLISPGTYTRLKAIISHALSLNDVIVYSLPEGLWVFCITLTSRHYYIRLAGWQMDCLYIPLIFSVGLELFQLLHITNGRFDLMDIAVSLLFWILGAYRISGTYQQQNILKQFNFKTTVCLVSYGIVYLAHVFK
ncbi:hypothetical protein ACFQZS_01740 [Mucilaginibacter calamicampi]|uniref:VanZ like family protein n=1 Tax=Mucilaginibacter calamicampi TaxID=1302352 RepID=A0ABW2YR21_9SPHI